MADFLPLIRSATPAAALFGSPAGMEPSPVSIEKASTIAFCWTASRYSFSVAV